MENTTDAHAKILVVDDERDIKSLFEMKFRREIRKGELAFSFAFSGEEALDYMKGHASEIILILSDINMPGMSGIELLKRIRVQHPSPNPKVMMVTAYNDDDYYQQAITNGANDFLTKPIDFSQLKEKLQSL
ncbi:response regulator [Persicitalea jodogahamensis]|uniref:Two-component response regulator n=1 Tax=Persicitalea jodogahamensis TaxID=402147 RepID=A0A8J3D6D8_9BACT|nr:response regulator [Persicitalea jodogahamensis]GHB81159.1 two-component response regulator [Persicitalea jodogahamensis]